MSKVTNLTVLQLDGSSEVVGTPTVTVLERDPEGYVSRAQGTTVPSDGDAGYAKGAIFTKTDGGASTVQYVNEGTSSSADFNLLRNPVAVEKEMATIATTGSETTYIIAPIDGKLESIDFTCADDLAANDTNYITFTVVNKGQDGSGSTAMLKAADDNTTKATGGSALTTDAKRSLILSTTASNLEVAKGDVLAVTVTATGTLANQVTLPTFVARFV